MEIGTLTALIASMVVGIIVGMGLMWLLGRNQARQAETFREEVARLREELAKAKEQAESARREKEQIELQLPEKFAAVSGVVLKDAKADLLMLAKASLGEAQMAAKGELDKKEQAIEALVKPIQENLDRLEK